MSDRLVLDTYRLLRKITEKTTEYFSGIGLVVYDSKRFDADSHCDLRPEINCPEYKIIDEKAVDYLAEISEYTHKLHDGFHMVNEDGVLKYVAQYFVPPVVKSLRPNQEHGVRLYSSMCGSLLEGVLFIGVISSDRTIFIIKEGQYIDINLLEEEIINEYPKSEVYI